MGGNKNLDPTVSVAAQTNGYATPSTYSHPSNDATIPRGTHNYDYHHRSCSCHNYLRDDGPAGPPGAEGLLKD